MSNHQRVATKHPPAASPDPATADIKALLTSPANRDQTHPQHAATRERIEAHYASLPGGNEPVI